MPLIAREHPWSSDSAAFFDRVLRDQPELASDLRQPDPQTRLYAGIFNERPVGLVRLRRSGQGWQVDHLVVHPASRGRNVGTTLLKMVAAQEPALGWPACLERLAARAGLGT